MSNINLGSLAKRVNIPTKSQFTYSDLQVDLKFDNIQQTQLNSTLKTKDLVANYDLGAIKNSIINFFTSFPGDKILNPEFGLNLNQFLFMPITVDTAQNIGDTIKNQLYFQEPRVKLKKLNIVADAENNQYNMTMILEVPFINNNDTIEFKALLNSTGINFYN